MQRGNSSGYLSCPNCGGICNRIPSIAKCKVCDGAKTTFRCITCIISHTFCEYCERRKVRSGQRERKISESKDAINTDTEIPYSYITAAVVLFTIVFLAFFISKYHDNNSEKLLKMLREEFPSQRNETWLHVQSVLNKTISSVKTITFLHGEDKRTPDCLTNKMVLLFSGDENIKSDDITFSAVGYEGKDYGFALEHYLTIVRKFRVFITDLTIVPGNLARIFHSLCDEVSSDIKPSLFIFTLKDDKSTAKLKPIARAGEILKKMWSDLPHNEIFPLLSRIVKNVVEILPEEQLSC